MKQQQSVTVTNQHGNGLPWLKDRGSQKLFGWLGLIIASQVIVGYDESVTGSFQAMDHWVASQFICLSYGVLEHILFRIRLLICDILLRLVLTSAPSHGQSFPKHFRSHHCLCIHRGLSWGSRRRVSG